MSSPSTPSDKRGGSDMSDGIMSVFEPAIRTLDDQVQATRDSQILLSSRIQEVADYLHDLTNTQPVDLDPYTRKLDDSKRRVANVVKTLESLQDRLGKLQRDIAREAYQKKQTITSIPPAPPLR
ncbi:unnamed protein product [Caenorhabditis auriculariae]|uniref:Biogenesis of lysosome-related organelles complex 1 subunit 7 n=1 Tax=Caenorhabditis auriculariae TaxID=2777116 RepID=A0A8S1HME7_9PELO|nr:unnamed protein product [Caenorhabditis auriculariae]